MRLILTTRPELQGQIAVAYCPERVLPGNVIFELVNNDRVIGGVDEFSTDIAVKFYSQFVKGTLHRTDCRTAEMCKLTENSFRDMQIAFANELSIVCDKAGIDVWQLIELANRHPRVNILKPGCGVGGHCIAVDPYFITSAFPEEAKLIAHARKVNDDKTSWCVEKINIEIENFYRKNNKQPRVALMGLAFKADIDDLRESPALKIASLMSSQKNAEFYFVEPNLKEHNTFKLVDYQIAFEKADIVVFLVSHTPFKILERRKDAIILDFCGVFKGK